MAALQRQASFAHCPRRWDYDGNGSLESTAITFSFNNGNDPDSQVILIGYTGAVDFFHEA